MKIKAGYIGIKEASQLVGVHPDTIRRLIKQHKGSPNIVQGKGEKAPYYLNADWLKSLYGLNEPHTAPVTADNQQNDEEPSPDTNNAISAVYEAHIKSLEHQLSEQNKTITELLQQHKDLISQQQQLQDQLKFILLPANTSNSQPVEVDVKQTRTSEPEPQVYRKSKKPQSRQKNATKQVKITAKKVKQPKKQSVKVAITDKPKRKHWWNR